jgi:hypothetical protein
VNDILMMYCCRPLDVALSVAFESVVSILRQLMYFVGVLVKVGGKK